MASSAILPASDSTPSTGGRATHNDEVKVDLQTRRLGLVSLCAILLCRRLLTLRALAHSSARHAPHHPANPPLLLARITRSCRLGRLLRCSLRVRITSRCVHSIDEFLHDARMLAWMDGCERLTGVRERFHRHRLERVIRRDIFEDLSGSQGHFVLQEPRMTRRGSLAATKRRPSSRSHLVIA